MIQIIAKTNPTNKVFTKEEIVNYIANEIDTSYDGANSHYAQQIDSICKSLCEHGLKVNAIRVMKLCLPVSLKEAKDYIESTYNV